VSHSAAPRCESQYLLTSIDLPIVSQVIEASEETPCLAMSLKLEMPVIRELLSQEQIQVVEGLRQSCDGDR
jgi:AraC-type transcriptional regulator N-terminus